MKRLTAEEIYDAAVDDELFASISNSLAQSLGGRSALIHWIHRDGETDILSHSGYFTNEQLGRYAREFALIDPWVVATSRPDASNQVNDLERYVPTEEFVRSNLYNDYIRAIGDDTARCIGVRLDGQWGSGFISVQRGLGQSRFEQRSLVELQRLYPHIARMMSIRGRLAAAGRQSGLAKFALDSLAQPVFLVDDHLRLKGSNAAADRLLSIGTQLTLKGGTLNCPQQRCNAALRRAVHLALKDGGAPGATYLEGAQRLNLSIVATSALSSARLAMIIAETTSAADPSRSRRMQLLYNLSAGETAVALLLADGLSLSEIADRRKVSLGTVRVQIKHIAAKLGCSRQSEIVRLVARLPVLATGVR